MNDHRKIPAVHMVEDAAYNRLCESDAAMDELFHMSRAGRDSTALEAAAIQLIEHLDPERAKQPGHVAYALGQTIPLLVRLAAQDARKRELRQF